MKFEDKSENFCKLIQTALDLCKEQFAVIDEICEINSKKVLKSFIDNKVKELNFASTTGYGYGDAGKKVLNSVFAQALDAESALVSANFISGTHAIAVALFAVARPGDTILCITGEPYDTLKTLIYDKNCGSLADFNINFKITDFTKNSINKDLQEKPEIIYIQRSRGYSLRNSITVEDIKKIILKIKKITSKSIIITDNCYGEFVQTEEPLSAGADLIIGSLIKNPGGGIAPSGAYIAGKKHLTELCEQRFTAPGVHGAGRTHCNRELFMGLFYAPQAVREALKTAVFASSLFEIIGFEVSPERNETRTDIIQTINFNSKEKMIKFCQTIQAGSPVDSSVRPEPWAMPGYQEKIIMASGGFISGSSIELSADAPIREPFTIWLQGGTNFYAAKYAIANAAEAVGTRANT
jgi:cystathionine beta-lyase family protein involved in aluminum resistance